MFSLKPLKMRFSWENSWAKKIGLKIKTHDIQTEKVKTMDNVAEMRGAAG